MTDDRTRCTGCGEVLADTLRDDEKIVVTGGDDGDQFFHEHCVQPKPEPWKRVADVIQHVVLMPDEFLLLQPKAPMTLDHFEDFQTLIPESLRDRILVIGPGIEVVVGRKVLDAPVPCVVCGQPAQYRRYSQFTGKAGIPYCTEHANQEKRDEHPDEKSQVRWEEIT